MERPASPWLHLTLISTPSSGPKMQSRLVLVRHGKPEIEEGTPSTQWPLSQSGREAAALLATQLSDFKFQSITSSPELKAISTTETIAQKLGLNVEIDDGLSEHKRHSTDFLPLEDFNAQIARLFESPWNELIFGDETANAALERFTRTLDRQYVSSGSGDVVVVTHGTIMSIYVANRLGIDPLPFWCSLTTPTAIVISGNEMVVLEPRGAAQRLLN
jgi:2,3-bisphosphoglycerate-dependent phosphoglycerate mutase